MRTLCQPWLPAAPVPVQLIACDPLFRLTSWVICAEALALSGVSSIDAVVVHALFPPELLNEFSRAGIRSLRSTNSVPHPTNGIALDRILADALRREVVGASTAEDRV